MNHYKLKLIYSSPSSLLYTNTFFFIKKPPYSKMSLPDFMTNPNAVLGDKDDEWRYNRIPDYTKVNATYEEGKI